MPVGSSSVPAQIDMCVPLVGCQNRFEPQTLQNPRLACGEDSYHCSDPARVMVR